MLLLSKSRIQTYVLCPQKFKYQYVDHVYAPKSQSMIEGSALHAIIEKSLIDERGVDVIESASEDFWSTINLEDTTYPDRTAIETAKASVEKEAREFVRLIGDIEVYDIETYLEYPLMNPLTGEVHEDIMLRGFTDLFVHDKASDSTRIVDIKTSSRSPAMQQAERSLDLDVYGYLTAQYLGWHCEIPTSLLYLVRTRTPKAVWLNSYRNINDYTRLYNTVLSVSEGIRNNLFWRNPSMTCSSCAYESICFTSHSKMAA